MVVGSDLGQLSAIDLAGGAGGVKSQWRGTSFIPVLGCDLIKWTRSGGPSSRRIGRDSVRAMTDSWISASTILYGEVLKTK